MRIQLAESNNKLTEIIKEGVSNVASFGKSDRKTIYRPEHQLEELRNLQEQLSSEKSEWQKQYAEEKSQLERERLELIKMQEQVKKEQLDVIHQREILYRKLEALQKEGIILSPSHNVVTANSSHTKASNEMNASISSDENNSIIISVGTPDKKLISSNENSSPLNYARIRSNISSNPINSLREKDMPQLPLHLCSATNMMTRGNASNLSIKQQLPLKLAANNVSNTLVSTPAETLASNINASNFNASNFNATNFNATNFNATNFNASNMNPPNINGLSFKSPNSSSFPASQQLLPLKLANESKSNNNPSLTMNSQNPKQTEQNIFSKSSQSSKHLHKSFSTRSIPTTSIPHHVRTGSSPAQVPIEKYNNLSGDENQMNASKEDKDKSNQEIFC